MIRLFDTVISIFGLILLSPIFMIIILLIKIDSKGPVFYKQIRVGKKGIDFELFKFRSMYLKSDIAGLLTVGQNDSRITKIGSFLRKYKFDELPQLINVLLGEMSLVGPRPEVHKYVDLYTEYQKKILIVKPGITDYASIAYRNENSLLENSENPEEYYIQHVLPEKIKLNMKFIENRSIFEYFKLIFLTFKVLIIK